MLPRYGVLPSINHLWKTAFHGVAAIMRELNRLLSEEDKDVHKILHYIMTLFSNEVRGTAFENINPPANSLGSVY